MYYWCKGEIYDMQALIECITIREDIEKVLKRMENKKKGVQ